MKFIALVSGGKDSCYNIVKCQQYGHELACIATLLPPTDNELDSYLYQTAGYNVLQHIAECLDVPCYQQQIKGRPVNQQLQYDERVDDDEVEDMYELLSRIIAQKKGIEGVACGTICSTYQRTRVENICQRLNLTPLTYLWQRDRSELLKELISNHVDAVLVKVAVAGLEPLKHLNKQLSNLQPTLRVLHNKYGLDLCGEGGEYETIVLNCPAFQNGKRLSIDKVEVIEGPGDISVGYLKIIDCKVVVDPEMTHHKLSISPHGDLVRSIERVRTMIDHISTETKPIESQPILPISSIPNYKQTNPHISLNLDGLGRTSLVLPTHPLLLSDSLSTESGAVQRQLATIFHQITQWMDAKGCTLHDVFFVHLYLSHVDLFPMANEEYCKHFGIQPPSRCCVMVDLPAYVLVAMDVQFLKGSHHPTWHQQSSYLNRSVLHVKSLSEWAPLCIGPYSQANCLMNSLIFVAGQIPLVPGTMNLLDVSITHPIHPYSIPSDLLDGLKDHLILSVRNATRILSSLGSSVRDTVGCTVYLNHSRITQHLLDGAAPHFTLEWIHDYVNALLNVNCGEHLDRLFEEDPVWEDQDEEEEGDWEEDTATQDPLEKFHEIWDRIISTDKGVTSKWRLSSWRDYPIQVVGVKDLPRRAWVEVEIIGMKNHETVQYVTTESITKIVGSDGLMGGQRMEGSSSDDVKGIAMDDWPVWTTFDPDLVDKVVVASDAVDAFTETTWICHHSYAKSLRSFSVGFIALHPTEEDPRREGLSTSKGVHQMCQNLLFAIQKQFDMTGFHPQTIHSLRIYYNLSSIHRWLQHMDSEGASSKVEIESTLKGIIATWLRIPINLIPAVGLVQGSDPVMMVQIICLDLIQIETELWIHH